MLLIRNAFPHVARGSIVPKMVAKFIFDMLTYFALIYLGSPVWLNSIAAIGQLCYVWYIVKRRLFLLSVDDQLLMHCTLYMSWILAMALLRTVPPDLLSFITESLVETISLDKGICKGNLYASLWYLALLIAYIWHLLQLYYTFTHKKQLVPEVKKFQNLPPKFVK